MAKSVSVIARNPIYHTPGKPPHQIGTKFELPEDEACEFEALGHVRFPGNKDAEVDEFGPRASAVKTAPMPNAPLAMAPKPAG